MEIVAKFPKSADSKARYYPVDNKQFVTESSVGARSTSYRLYHTGLDTAQVIAGCRKLRRLA